MGTEAGAPRFAGLANAPAGMVATAVMYFAVAKLSLIFAIPPGYATAVWPPSGIALAVLLLWGARMWPGAWAGATAVNFSIAHAVVPSLAIGIGNTLEALTAWLILQRRLSSPRDPLATVSDIVVLVAASAASSAIAASVGLAVLFATGALAGQSAGLTWLTWWLGDVTGMLVVAPLLLGWVRPGEVRWSPERAIEIGALGALLLGVTFVVFGGWVQGGAPLPITFLVLPFVIWAAVRFSVREVTTLTVMVGVAAVSLTVTGHGPFVAADPQQALLLLQAFIGTLAVTGLVLTVLVHERVRVAESLRKTQHDLEQFVYVAAHDLQEPVRAVINFSELLQTRHRSKLDAEGGEFLEIVVSAGTKMHRRIEDLLEYSRVSHGRMQLLPTESGRALSTALRSLDETIRASGATVTRDAMPRVVADELMISHVFENLVGNALKYCGEQPPRVHISARPEGACWRFQVRDHGIGIDEKHSERVFDMYHRLNAREKYPGSGLGLSICRRIIERHDGRIWLESSKAGHTVFAFTIPAAGGTENAGA